MSTISALPASLSPASDRPGQVGGRGSKSTGPEPAASHAKQDSVELSKNRKPTEESRELGVVRLLRDGHFQGKVADVRLRMNFAEHFTEDQAADAPPSLAETSEAMLGAVQEKLAELEEMSEEPAAYESAQAAVSSFEQTLAELNETSAEDQPAASELLTTARETLIDALDQALLSDAEPTEGVNVEDLEQNEQATENDPLATWLAELDGALNALIEELSTPDDSTGSGLPPLAEPSGHGAAYEKFLAQYQQMMGLPDNADESTEEPAPEVVSDETSVDVVG